MTTSEIYIRYQIGEGYIDQGGILIRYQIGGILIRYSVHCHNVFVKEELILT